MRSCDGSTGIPEARLYRPPWAAASGTWQREASPGLDASRCPYLKTSVSRQKFIVLTADETRGTTFVFEEIDRERFLYYMIPIPFKKISFPFNYRILFIIVQSSPHMCCDSMQLFSYR